MTHQRTARAQISKLCACWSITRSATHSKSPWSDKDKVPRVGRRRLPMLPAEVRVAACPRRLSIMSTARARPARKTQNCSAACSPPSAAGRRSPDLVTVRCGGAVASLSSRGSRWHGHYLRLLRSSCGAHGSRVQRGHVCTMVGLLFPNEDRCLEVLCSMPPSYGCASPRQAASKIFESHRPWRPSPKFGESVRRAEMCTGTNAALRPS